MVVDASRRIGHRVAPKPRESSTRSRDYTLEMRGDSAGARGVEVRPMLTPIR